MLTTTPRISVIYTEDNGLVKAECRQEQSANRSMKSHKYFTCLHVEVLDSDPDILQGTLEKKNVWKPKEPLKDYEAICVNQQKAALSTR